MKRDTMSFWATLVAGFFFMIISFSSLFTVKLPVYTSPNIVGPEHIPHFALTPPPAILPDIEHAITITEEDQKSTKHSRVPDQSRCTLPSRKTNTNFCL